MRWLCCELLGLLVLGTLGVVVFYSFRHSERIAFERRVDALRDAGEPVSSTDVFTVQVPPEEDARRLLESVGQRSGFLNGSRVFGVERARRLEELLSELEYALERPLCSVPSPAPGCPVTMDEVAFLYWVNRVLKECVGSTRDPLAIARHAVRFADLLKPHGSYAVVENRSTAVATAADALAAAAKRKELHAMAARREFAGQFRRFEDSLDLQAILRNERAIMIDHVRKWKQFGRDLFVKRNGSSKILDKLDRTWVWEPVVFRDGTRMLDCFGEAIQRATGIRESVRADLERWSKQHDRDKGHPLAANASSFPERCVKVLLRGLSRSRQTRIALAVWECRERSGEYPPSLDVLEFESGVPQDPVAEGPFRYERTEYGARLIGQSLDEEPFLWEFGKP